MATGTSCTGKTIIVGDQVSIQGTVYALSSGSGSTAVITVETNWTPNLISAQANDMNAVEQANDALHTALSFNGGKNFGQVQDQVTVLGTVTAISGSGVTASLSVKLVTSGATVSVPAGACTAASPNAGQQ